MKRDVELAKKLLEGKGYKVSKRMNEAGWMVNHPGYDPIGAPAPYDGHRTADEPEPYWVAHNKAEIEKLRKAQGAPADAIYDGETGYFEDPKNPDHFWDEKAKAYNWVFIDGKGWVNESAKYSDDDYDDWQKGKRNFGPYDYEDEEPPFPNDIDMEESNVVDITDIIGIKQPPLKKGDRFAKGPTNDLPYVVQKVDGQYIYFTADFEKEQKLSKMHASNVAIVWRPSEHRYIYAQGRFKDNAGKVEFPIPKEVQSSVSESKKMRESSGLKYVCNTDGYSCYRKIENGKGVWFAKRQDDPDDKMFPISYEQARGYEEMPDATDIEKLQREMGDMLLPKNESKNPLRNAIHKSLKKLHESLDYEDMKYWNHTAIGSAVADYLGIDATQEEIESEIANILDRDDPKFRRAVNKALREIEWDRYSTSRDPMNGHKYQVGGATPNVTETGTDYDVHDGGYKDDPQSAITTWLQLSQQNPTMVSIDTNKNAYAQELLQWVVDNEEEFRSLCDKYRCPYKVDYMIDGCKKKLQRPSNFESKHNYPDQIYPFALG